MQQAYIINKHDKQTVAGLQFDADRGNRYALQRKWLNFRCASSPQFRLHSQWQFSLLRIVAAGIFRFHTATLSSLVRQPIPLTTRTDC